MNHWRVGMAEPVNRLERFIARALHNLPQKLGAVVAAVALWFAASGERQATVERTFDAALLVRGKAEDQVVTDLARTVSVTLSGARDRLDGLTAGLVEASINVEGLPDGPFQAPVTVTPPADTTVARVTPKAASGRVDAVVSQSVPVQVAVSRAGLNTLVVAVAAPRDVTATGPRGRLASVASALALAGPGAVSATLTAIDDNGLPVQGVTLHPARVRLSFTQSSVLTQKLVMVRLAAPTGKPYRDVVIAPARVRLVGPPSVVNAIGFVTASPATPVVSGTQKVRLTLEIPSGVDALDQAVATLTVTP